MHVEIALVPRSFRGIAHLIEPGKVIELIPLDLDHVPLPGPKDHSIRREMEKTNLVEVRTLNFDNLAELGKEALVLFVQVPAMQKDRILVRVPGLLFEGTRQNAVFLHGWHLHEKYQRLFAEFGQIVEVECSHFDEVRFLHFTPDAVIFWAGQRYVVEIKGYKLDHFARLDEVGDPPEAAWHQCNLYMHVLGIERGLILVECKDTQELKVWCIEHDALLARPYMDRCYSVKGAVTTGHIPARICQSCQEHRAEKCPVRDFCFSGRIKENS